MGPEVPPPGRSPGERAALKRPERRRLLAVLLAADHPLTERDLAVALEGRAAQASPAELDPAAVVRRRLELHHRDLPALVAAGLVERWPEGVVAAGDLPFDAASLERPVEAGPVDWGVAAALARRPRRAAVVALLADRTGPVALEDLARALVDREDRPGARLSAERARLELHHLHLPRLEELGLVTYGRRQRSVVGHPALGEVVRALDNGPVLGDQRPP